MITPRRSADRGHADHGWLDTYHTFSFADYWDPGFMGFSKLRVLNQDVVAPGRGFPMHFHDNMEIVTLVLSGVLEHEDSMGNGSKIRPGEVQLMSAGTGVHHSESNTGTEPVELLQMWVLPARAATKPRYEQRAFPPDELRGHLRLVVSPHGDDGSLTIGQDASLYASTLAPGERAALDLPPSRSAWLHVARGTVSLNGLSLAPGDGAAIRDESHLDLHATLPADFVLWDLP